MRKIISFVSFLCAVLILAGCGPVNAKMSGTFTVDNGDEIKMELNTSDGYELSLDVPFSISQNGVVQSQGTFIQGEYYEQYVAAAQSDDKATVLDSGSVNGNDYVFWCYDGSEYNYVISIKDSNTGILLGNPVSEESARECFERLTISVID